MRDCSTLDEDSWSVTWVFCALHRSHQMWDVHSRWYAFVDLGSSIWGDKLKIVIRNWRWTFSGLPSTAPTPSVNSHWCVTWVFCALHRSHQMWDVHSRWYAFVDLGSSIWGDKLKIVIRNWRWTFSGLPSTAPTPSVNSHWCVTWVFCASRSSHQVWHAHSWQCDCVKLGSFQYHFLGTSQWAKPTRYHTTWLV